MGGDGGVIASNRRYMRGAGVADHTGDGNNKGGPVDPAVEKEELRRTMSTCAVSGQPLRFGKETIVVCPYGRLYHKEAAVEALLKRKQEESDTIGYHVRGLKDLKEVRFHLNTASDGTVVPACPVRGTELNGQIPAVALVPGGTINVVSERALKEMGDDILEEYGPSKKIVKLAPTAAALREIKDQRKEDKKSKEKEGKRKREQTTGTESALGDEIRAKVASKVKKSEALSSLFTTGTKAK